ncbi:hypothetical protein Mapa_016720 [Marchantia paleacea]|nr:hypothetical protein Mapa_016720 [Marchantia paleacea]
MEEMYGSFSSFIDEKLLAVSGMNIERVTQLKEELPVPTWITVIIAGIALLLIVRRIFQGRRLRLAPGPLNLPIIGAILSLGTELHKEFADLSHQYGPVVHLRLGSLPVVIVSSAEVAEELMREKDAEFASRAHDAILYSNATYFGFGASNMGFAPYTPTLKQVRKVCTTELLASSKISNSSKIRFEEQGEMLKEARDITIEQGAFMVREVVHTMTMNVVCRMLFKKRYYGKDVPVTKELQEFQSLMIEMVDTAGKLNISDLLPSLRWLDPQGLTAEFKKLHARQRRILSRLLEDHKKVREDRGHKVQEPEMMDFVDILLSLEGEDKLSDTSIMATTSDMLIGASDTAATTVEWALIELLRNPQVMAKLQQELDRVVGRGRAMVEADIPDLPYLEAVTKEVLRMYPPLPLLIPRMNESVTTLGSYDIPKRTSVFVNIWAIGRDPKLWDKPEEFIPERFLNSNMNVVGNNFQYIPFGAGRRKCVGINLGQLMVQRTIGCLVHAFDLQPPSGKTPYDISNDDEYGMVLRPKHPVLVRAVPRIPSLEVYDGHIH